MFDGPLSMHINVLSNQTSRVMHAIQELGSDVPSGTPLGDKMLRLMDIVIDLDSAIDKTQEAAVFLGSSAIRSRLARQTTMEDQAAELLQARRDRRSWEEEKQAMERTIADYEQKMNNLQELNSMLMERGRGATTPSSGFSSAPHSPRSMGEQNEQSLTLEAPTAPTAVAASAASAAETPQQNKITLVPPRKPERKQSVKMPSLRYTPEFRAVSFKDSIQLHSCPKLESIVDMDDTIELSDSSEAPDEGPFHSTFKEEISIYHTPTTSKKSKMRRRSSSLGDAMKRIFTPKKSKVKNPILRVLDD